jgi:hypothetical protein
LIFLPAAKPEALPLSLVLMPWVSIALAVGEGTKLHDARPADQDFVDRRPQSRSRQAQKHPCTVETGGNSFGNIRRWHPLEDISRIPSTTSRSFVVHGQPPGPQVRQARRGDHMNLFNLGPA